MLSLDVILHMISMVKVAFTLGQNTPRKMVVFFNKKIFFIYQIAKSTAYYAALYPLCEHALNQCSF